MTFNFSGVFKFQRVTFVPVPGGSAQRWEQTTTTPLCKQHGRLSGNLESEILQLGTNDKKKIFSKGKK